MKMWIQIRGRDEDEEYPDAATYEVLAGGVLKITSGNAIHLYSPGHWKEVMIDTRPADERARQIEPSDEDLKWQ